MILENKSVR